MDREPVVAGQFYPAGAAALHAEVRRFLALAPGRAPRPTILAMAPHAGYVYSGAVAGRTLGQANLARTVILLGPNHTGLGQRLAVWPAGRWLFPGGSLAVDRDLAQALLDADPRLAADTLAHAREHSLEVLVPFLWAVDPEISIVPIAVADPRLSTLQGLGETIARVAAGAPGPVSLVVSSDMNHFADQARTRVLDGLALAAVEAMDPAALLQVVRENGVSMCGVMPMTAGLFAAKAMGAASARVAAYATSGDVSGDLDRVVGYAGVLVD